MIETIQEILIATIGLIEDILTNPFVNGLLLPIILLILAWILKSFYDKYFVIKPRLFLSLGNPLFRKRTKEYAGYELTWRYECELKNNSKLDAYNIELFEIKSEDDLITNKPEIRDTFPKNNHLGSNESKYFEIKKTINVEPDVLFKSKIENGKKNVPPVLKVQRPEVELKPGSLNKIRLLVKYENEKGNKFYIKFTRHYDKETSKIKLIRPFWFNKIKKLNFNINF